MTPRYKAEAFFNDHEEITPGVKVELLGLLLVDEPEPGEDAYDVLDRLYARFCELNAN